MAGRIALYSAVLALNATLLAGQAKPTRVRVSGGVMAGQLTKKVDPVPSADHMIGAVVLQVVIDTEGKVEEATAVSGPSSLRESAVTAVRQWVYRPFLLNGEPVEVQSTVTVNFK